MKESVYGWYPAAKDVYRNAARYHNNPYELECMYRFQNSKYYNGQIVPPGPTISLGLRDIPGTEGHRVPSPPKGRKTPSRHRENVDLDQGSPCLVIKPAPRMKPEPIPTPLQAWEKPCSTQATPITVRQATAKYQRYWKPQCWGSEESVCSRYQDPREVDNNEKTVNLDWPVVSREQVVVKRHPRGYRIMSAPVNKGRPPTPCRPRRPIKSARPSRPNPPTPEYDPSKRPQTCPAAKSQPLAPVPKRDTNSANPSLDRPDGTQSRPQNPTPNMADLYLEDRDLSDGETSSKDEYEENLEKYGWRAEIPGDPYGLKKVKKRLSYTVTCDDPVIPPEPPGGHMENWQTFFINTIPRRPATYTIQKEWMSEVIHAKRMELQKKKGVNFNFKKFAFAY